MVASEQEPQKELHSVGEQLGAAREAMGMSLSDVADRTRIPVRHLASIETMDFAALPGPTYCLGFARAYARTVGENEVEIAQKMRRAMDATEASAVGRYESTFEPADPARVPPRWLAWTAILIALLLVAGYGAWRSGIFTGGNRSETEIALEDGARQDDPGNAPAAAGSGQAAAPAEPKAPTGEVVLTATDAVWMRIYEPDGNKLFEGQLNAGDRYAVPATAKDPQILTGRPDVLRVTVGGTEVPPLGTADHTISDVGVSAAALAARAQANPPPAAPTTAG